MTWAEYQTRELAEIEIVYSSIVYLYDIGIIIACSKYRPQVDVLNESRYLLRMMSNCSSHEVLYRHCYVQRNDD